MQRTHRKGARRLIAAITALAFVAAACGDDDEGSSENTTGAAATVADTAATPGSAPGSTSGGTQAPATTSESEPGEPITYADWQTEGAGRGAALKAAVEGYANAEGGVQVNIDQIAFPQYQDTLLTQLGGGNGPDVFNLTVDEFYNIQSQGLLHDLTDLVERPAEDFISADSYSFVDERRYGVIHSVQSYALFINRDLFDAAGLQPPTTYEELRAAAEQLTTGDTFGYAVRHSMSDEAGWWYDLSNWVYGFGGRWTDEAGTPTVDSPEVIAAVEAFAELVNAGVHPYGSDGATNRRMFWENKVAMMIDNAAVPSNLLAENPDLNLEIVEVPFETKSTVIIPIFTVVNAESDNIDEAVGFINYFVSEPVQSELTMATKGNILATSKEVPAELAESSPWLDVFAEGAQTAFLAIPTGFETNAAAFRTAVLREVDQVIVSGKSAADAMADAQAAVQDL